MTKLSTLAVCALGSSFMAPAHGASLVQSFLTGTLGAPGNTPITFVFEDDDATTFIDNTPDSPTVVVGGDSVALIEAGDQFSGVVIFPSIETASAAEFTLDAPTPFELTATYLLTVVSNPGTFATALVGTLSIFEDDTPDFDFGAGSPTGFDDGVSVGVFDLTGNAFSNSGVFAGSASPLDAGDATGVSLSLFAFLRPDSGLLADPELFSGIIGTAQTLTFGLFGPNPGFDFLSDGNLSINGSIVPSPAAAGVGVLGALGLLASRRRRETDAA